MNQIALARVNVSARPGLDAWRLQLAAIPLPRRTIDLLADSDGPIGGPLHALVEYLIAGETGATCYRREVGRLVGLGPGLTPTGDDVLVALVATSRRLSAIAPIGPGLSLAIAAIPAGLTTDVAHHLLMASVDGRFPEPLAALVNALGDPSVHPETVAALARRLAGIGAHSGADWLAGVVALARAFAAKESGVRSQESGAGESEAPESRFLNPDSCVR